jgi:2-polyprenyl-3-methyl-5-hydroxy-6-metoxy-1,4-benzoquinol methylase
MVNRSRYQIIKTNLGYFRVDPLPTEEELANRYAHEYYQNPHGTYQASYSEVESTQLKLRVELIYHATISNLQFAKNSNRILDLGCGEGFLLSHFKDAGWKVLGIDFSDEGVKKQNPKLIKDIVKGNVYKELEVLINEEKNYDVIHLGNILEHVIDPLMLVTKSSDLLSEGGLLVITVPNDFSIL